jgi:TolA-binding protein
MDMSLKKLIPAVFTLMALGACTTAQTQPEPETADAQPTEKTQAAQAQDQITQLQNKIQDLETRISALNDKINLDSGVKNESAKDAVQTQVVQSPAAHAKMIPTTKPSAKKVKEGGGDFTQNEAVDRFREAKILYDSKRYADSVLEFSDFIKNEPDHVLASAAQYFVGMSYYQQKEYKLAEEELNRGLIAYPHSNYTPDTLLALSQVSADLQKPARVTYYKQKLLSNFPNSPQAKGLNLDAPVAAPKKAMRTEPVEMPEAPVPPTAPDSAATEGDNT